MACRVDEHFVYLLNSFASQRVYLRYSLNGITEKLKPYSSFGLIRRKYFNHITSYPECASEKIIIIPLILNFYQSFQNLVTLSFHALFCIHMHASIVFGRAYTVDA